ncbi:MAG: L,D-transpeptidase family protein [Gemmatimonadaceae bacterium]|jgi:murein L,D-transpeptidase YcbB/YkuD
MHTRHPFARPASILVLATLIAISACSRGESASDTDSETAAPWAPEQLTSVNGVPAAEIMTAMKAKLAEEAPPTIDGEQWRHAKALYKAYGDKPLWLTSKGLHEARTRALTDAILAVHSDAMRVDDYPIGRLATALAAVKGSDKATADQLAEADVVLTASYAALGEDLLTGQINPKTVAQSWFVDPQEENVDSALVRGLRIDALDRSLATMRPQDSDYQALRIELDRYRKLVLAGGWPKIPLTKSVKPGERISPAVATALRTRLTAQGIAIAGAPQGDTSRAAATAPAATYDRSLAGAVAEFQARSGIVVDSILGGGTLEALNMPAQYRLAQIAANMERYRWLPRTLGSKYIFVNVPAFRLQAYDAGKVVLEMKIIVGEEYENRATPVFSDSMEYVVFRPYWLVPTGIAQKEIFPKGQGYLAANNMEVYTAQGETRVRQRPGEKNALGLIKFMFPNDFAIYLHDTANPELFDKDVRGFSHGCIRVQHPDRLANFVLGWPVDRINTAMNSGEDDTTVRLPSKIPVYIAYVTTYMRDNRLYFGNDLYSRDDKLVEAVSAAAMPTTKAVEAVQALRRIAER